MCDVTTGVVTRFLELPLAFCQYAIDSYAPAYDLAFVSPVWPTTNLLNGRSSSEEIYKIMAVIMVDA
jgi:hypothetical protein